MRRLPLLLVLFAAVAAHAATQSNYAGTCSNDSSVGTYPWGSPSNATASDDSYSTVLLPVSAYTHYLRCGNFGFTIPSGAVINGITVVIERTQAGDSGKDYQVRIVTSDGGVGSQNKASPAVWPTSPPDATESYGSSSDLWAQSWCAASPGVQSCSTGVFNVNHGNFGVAMSATSGTNTTALAVDSFEITIDYTAPTATTAPTSTGTPTHTATAGVHAATPRTPGAPFLFFPPATSTPIGSPVATATPVPSSTPTRTRTFTRTMTPTATPLPGDVAGVTVVQFGAADVKMLIDPRSP